MLKNVIKIPALAVIISLSQSVGAQVTESANFIKGGERDALKIVSAYLSPIEKALGYNGTNNNLLLFRSPDNDGIRVGAGISFTTSFINNDDFTFDIADLSLEEFEPADMQKTTSPTFAGNENTIALQTKDYFLLPTTTIPFYVQTPILSLESPKGMNRTYIPFPAVNLFAEKAGNFIDLKFLPPVRIENGDIGLFNIGFSLQHNIETSLLPLSNLWFDLYLSGGFNYSRIIYYLDIRPDESILTFSPQSDNGPYDDQEFIMSSKSLPVRVSAVKSYKSFSFFIGGGYSFMNSSVKMAGVYPLYATDPLDQFQVIAVDIENPFTYTNRFNRIFFELGASCRLSSFFIGIKYAHSFYKNLELSFGFDL